MKAYIVACGAYCENVTDELPVLKQAVKGSVGHSVRRVGRFIQLALIGAGRAATDLAPNSAVYLTSGRGDIGSTVEALDTIYRQGQAPRPVNFINTVSNAACFYIARSLDLQGPAVFVASRYFSLEMALKSALLDLQSQRTASALVGAVDAVVAPPIEHRQRLGLALSAPVAEGSHWLQLVGEPGERLVLGVLESITQFGDRAALSRWLSSEPLAADTQLAIGQYMSPDEGAKWRSETGMSAVDYVAGIGHFDSQVGRVLCQFVAGGAEHLLHINRDPHGRYVAVVISKTPY